MRLRQLQGRNSWSIHAEKCPWGYCCWPGLGEIAERMFGSKQFGILSQKDDSWLDEPDLFARFILKGKESSLGSGVPFSTGRMALALRQRTQTLHVERIHGVEGCRHSAKEVGSVR